MFTGIVEDIGVVENLQSKANLAVLSIRSAKISRGVNLGDSIAVNGVCLTVTSAKADILTFDLMKETLSATSLRQLKKKSPVNLERALKANSRLGGHFVTGHVDAVAVLKKIQQDTNYVEWVLSIPAGLKQYFVPKGSITVDGVSLTVGAVKAATFSVYLIPFTLDATNFSQRREGDVVNIETDVLAKYVLSGQSRQ
jgi:riboflavin synthase